MAKAKNVLTVSVSKKNIVKGKCADEHKCAIAQALVDVGFDTAAVNGNTAVVTKKVKVGNAVIVSSFWGILPIKTVEFIGKFDDAVTEKLKKTLKPFSFNLQLLSADPY